MKYCKNCGKEFDDSINLCSICGGNLEPNNSNKKPKLKNKSLKIILIIVALLGISCFMVVKIIDNNNKKQIEANKLLAFATYKEIGEFGGYGPKGLALVKKEIKDENGESLSRYGFINTKFEECIPCIYHRIEPFMNNFAIVELDGKYALMNKDGIIEQPLKYNNIRTFEDKNDFHSDYSFALAEINGRFILIDRSGKALCQEYDEIDYMEWRNDCWGDSYNRLARVKKGDKWGFLDNHFNEKIHCIYNDAKCFYKSVDHEKPIAPVRLFAEWKWIDTDETRKYIEDGLTIVRLSDKYAVMNEKGEVEKELEYSSITRFYAKDEYHTLYSFAEAKDNGYVTLINRKGESLCPKYEDISYTGSYGWGDDGFWGLKSKRLAWVYKDGKFGYMDNDFHEVVPCIYDDCHNFYKIRDIEKLICCVCLNRKWGMIDAEGNKMIDCIYDECFYFEEYELIDEENNKTKEVLAKVKKEGKEFYINVKGDYFGSTSKENPSVIN